MPRVLIDIKGRDFRKPDHAIEPFFVDRWSPRAMSGEDISREELMRMFEASRWAMSSMNNQPWRFLYAFRNTPHWDRFFGLLTPNNQGWCKNAGVLIVVVSRRHLILTVSQPGRIPMTRERHGTALRFRE